jgi:hypothetical protein
MAGDSTTTATSGSDGSDAVGIHDRCASAIETVQETAPLLGETLENGDNDHMRDWDGYPWHRQPSVGRPILDSAPSMLRRKLMSTNASKGLLAATSLLFICDGLRRV